MNLFLELSEKKNKKTCTMIVVVLLLLKKTQFVHYKSVIQSNISFSNKNSKKIIKKTERERSKRKQNLYKYKYIYFIFCVLLHLRFKYWIHKWNVLVKKGKFLTLSSILCYISIFSLTISLWNSFLYLYRILFFHTLHMFLHGIQKSMNKLIKFLLKICTKPKKGKTKITHTHITTTTNNNSIEVKVESTYFVSK